MTTELSFWGHACIRLDRDGRRLVIDPGSFSSEDAARGAHAVLVTHEHADHVVPAQLRTALEAQPDLHVWGPAPVIDQLQGVPGAEGRVHVVAGGDHVEAAGFTVEVLGEQHAVIHPDVPRVANVGYLIDGLVLHPGDSVVAPANPAGVAVLCLPVAAPWLKLSEAVDLARAVAPRILVPIHDALLSTAGNALVDRLVPTLVPGEYHRMLIGDSLIVS